MELNLNPVTNPWSLCLSLPILLLTVFFGWAVVAGLQERQQIDRASEDVERVIKISRVDAMTAREFRDYVGQLLRRRGYALTPAADDAYGMSLLAEKDGQKIAVLAVRHKLPISPRMVREAAAQRDKLGRDAAWVVTSSHARADTRKVAAELGCQLVEREALAEWIEQGYGRLSRD